MFGHDNNQNNDDAVAAAQDGIDAAADAIANDNDTPAPASAPDPGTLGSFMATPVPTVPTQDAPAEPSAPELTAPSETPSPAADDSTADADTAVHDDAAVAPAATSVDTDDLLDLKQEALEALTPLVGQLDQSPEEEFRTTMMMIQASDNHQLIKKAYEAALKINNEKERAQALLDIVNEINYFTQQA